LPMHKREEMYPPGHERVVLSDNIRPDWYQALAHRRRVEARRLATATALQQALAVAGQRRSSRGTAGRLNTTNGALTTTGAAEQRRVGRRVDGMIRITRDEADEMMLQEAIRQSLQTQDDERQKREEEERKKAGIANADSPTDGATSSSIPRLSMSTSSSPITASALPRLQPATSTSPPSARSFFSAFRARSGSGSSRNGIPPPPVPPQNRRPSSTNNLYPPINTIRRQPSLPDALLASTSVSLATAMHDSIIPGTDARPSVSSPLATQVVNMPSVQVDSSETLHETRETTAAATSVSTSSTLDEITPVPGQHSTPDSGLKRRDDGGSVDERELVEESH
jgi:hypothetical protein